MELVSLNAPSTLTKTEQLTRIIFGRKESLDASLEGDLHQISPDLKLWVSEPVYFPQKGEPLFMLAEEMVSLAEQRGVSLGEIALAYEATLLGMSETAVMDEMIRRYEIMKASVIRGLDPTDFTHCQPVQARSLKPKQRENLQRKAFTRVLPPEPWR